MEPPSDLKQSEVYAFQGRAKVDDKGGGSSHGRSSRRFGQLCSFQRKYSCYLVYLLLVVALLRSIAFGRKAETTSFFPTENNSVVIKPHRQQEQKLELPSMTAQAGGMIFFLHVPKTGGSTVRGNFGRASSEFGRNVEYIVGNWRSKLDCNLQRIHDYLSFNNNNSSNNYNYNYNNTTKKNNPSRRRVLFVEVHGMDSYNVLELQKFIENWRNLAKTNNVPFFAFTMLRQAVAAQISFFNFFRITFVDCRFRRIPPGKNNNETEIEEELLIPWSYDNPQCLFMARGERTMGERHMDCYPDYRAETNKKCPPPGIRRLSSGSSPTAKNHTNRRFRKHRNLQQNLFPKTVTLQMEKLRLNLTREECMHTYSVLKASMDWIGVLERANDETFPMLTSMIYGNSSMASRLSATNTVEERTKGKRIHVMQMANLKNSTIEQLFAKSVLDDAMYQRASAEYTTDLWSNFPRQPEGNYNQLLVESLK